jgi:hypothetical protein
VKGIVSWASDRRRVAHLHLQVRRTAPIVKSIRIVLFATWQYVFAGRRQGRVHSYAISTAVSTVLGAFMPGFRLLKRAEGDQSLLC